MQKGQWKSAIKISKKAKDRSIYNFIKWRHLLTTGNQESFFENQLIIFLGETFSVESLCSAKYLNLSILG